MNPHQMSWLCTLGCGPQSPLRRAMCTAVPPQSLGGAHWPWASGWASAGLGPDVREVKVELQDRTNRARGNESRREMQAKWRMGGLSFAVGRKRGAASAGCERGLDSLAP